MSVDVDMASRDGDEPIVLGSYVLLEEIGSGGMGTVYLAERADGAFQKNVAIKIARLSLSGEDRSRRFRSERQILAQLEHAGIARLLDGGTTPRGEPYLVMEHVAGLPVDEHCDGLSLPVARRLELFAQICDAVAYAHQRGIVHRDLKPANILVTTGGEPKLLDFGIARLLDPEGFPATVEVTGTGQLLLTPSYASPEQLRGDEVTPASDVYTLGVVLYQLLTGRLPFHLKFRDPLDAQRVVLHTDPMPPSRAVVEIPEWTARHRGVSPAELGHLLAGDLDRIVLKALSKEPARRYGDAAALAADVRSHLSGRPIVARGDSWLYRGSRWIRRHRTAAAFFAVVLAFSLFEVVRPNAGGPAVPPAPGLEGSILPAARSAEPLTQRLYDQGVDALRRRDAELARKDFAAALEADPGFALAHAAMSEALSVLGRDPEAAEAAAAAQKLSGSLPRPDQLWIEARYHETALRWDEAARAYSALWTFYPKNVEHGLRLALVQIQGQHYSEALTTIEKLRLLPPPASEDPRLDLLESKAAFYAEEFARATAAAQHALDSAGPQGAPSILAEAHFKRAWPLVRLGRLEEAAADFEAARKLYTELGDESQTARTLNGLASVYGQQSRYDEAVEVYRQALEVQTRLGARRHIAPLRLNLASILLEQGHLEEGTQQALGARDLYRELGLASGEASAIQLIAETSLNSGKLADARLALRDLDGFCETLKSPSLCTIVRALEGKLHEMSDDMVAAAEAYRRAQEAAAQAGLSVFVTQLDAEQACLALDLGDANRAVELTRDPVRALDEQGFADPAALAMAVRLKALLSTGADGTELAERLHSHLEVTESAMVRLYGGIAYGRYLAAAGDAAAAEGELSRVAQEAADLGYVVEALNARLAFLEVALGDGDETAHQRLLELSREASAEGLALLARQASEAAARGVS